MDNGSYFIPRQHLEPFFADASMNAQEGLYVAWETEPTVARSVVPPQLELVDPAHPLVSLYVVNIREPTFAPWYMEAGLSLLCRFGDVIGVYFLNLQLSGPGAPMGMASGRELSSLPKKLCERIVVERNGSWAHALVQSKGRRLLDLEVVIGDHSVVREPEHGCCFLIKMHPGSLVAGMPLRYLGADLIRYEAVTRFDTWEPGSVSALDMEPSLDDPWAELCVVRPLSAAYSRNANWVEQQSVLASYEGDEADDLIQYSFAGRWDRSTLAGGSQRYGQFS